MNKYIYPQWQVPAGVRSVSTTRLGGTGLSPYDSFNLGAHVGDELSVVKTNRELLCDECVLSVMTADCLPILLAAKNGSCVAVIHGGWRSLYAGVVQQTVSQLPVAAADLLAWLGPAIGPKAFEVGEEVYEAFVTKSVRYDQCFRARETEGKFLADIFAIGKLCLEEAGVVESAGGDRCTFQEKTHFFSHRRDGAKTGRMASLIWIAR